MTMNIQEGAFFGDPEVKDKYLKRIVAHQLAGDIRQKYAYIGRACGAVASIVHSDDYKVFEKKLNIPQNLAYIMEDIFDELPDDQAVRFPLQCLGKIPVRADLSTVLNDFSAWFLNDARYGVHWEEVNRIDLEDKLFGTAGVAAMEGESLMDYAYRILQNKGISKFEFSQAAKNHFLKLLSNVPILPFVDDKRRFYAFPK